MVPMTVTRPVTRSDIDELSDEVLSCESVPVSSIVSEPLIRTVPLACTLPVTITLSLYVDESDPDETITCEATQAAGWDWDV